MSMAMIELESLINYHHQPCKEIINGNEISPIEDEYIDNIPSVIDRFFTKYFFIKSGSNNPNEAYMVLFHSNRVCVICLAPCHPALCSVGNCSIGISFRVGNLDRSSIKVKGRGKKGGMALQRDSTLAILNVDNTCYRIPSCINSKLVEVNEELIKNPHLIAIGGAGYIAIVIPKPENCENIIHNLLTEEQFKLKGSVTRF